MVFIPRMKISGRKASEEKIITEISDLLKGTSRRPYPLPIAEIARVLGVSRQTIYKYIQRKKNKPLKFRTGRYALPKPIESNNYRRFNKEHKITSDPLVAEWMDDLLTRKQGNPIKSWRDRICSLEAVCNTCNVLPQDLIVSKNRTEKIMRTYAKLYQAGQVKQSPQGQRSKGLNTSVHRRVQAVRSFCAFYDITWNKGVTGIMSQKVVSHGKYADVRLNVTELAKADEFIKERWGLDSDIYRWFWVGIESCSRFNALYNMSLEYEKHVNSESGKTTFIMTVFESKTEHIRGGKWFKYITRPDTQHSLELLKSRGANRIFESKLPQRAFQDKISEQLREIYRHIGKNSSYFSEHATHVLRHIGAHYWLSKKDYNYGLIAEVGGWHTIDELKKSYGQIPPEKILEMIE